MIELVIGGGVEPGSQVDQVVIDPSAVNPIAIQVMDTYHIDIRDQQPKGLNLFLDQSFGYIITVCDRARETCPIFLGNPIKIHWSIADPTAFTGNNRDRVRAFQETAEELNERTDYFLASLSRPVIEK